MFQPPARPSVLREVPLRHHPYDTPAGEWGDPGLLRATPSRPLTIRSMLRICEDGEDDDDVVDEATACDCVVDAEEDVVDGAAEARRTTSRLAGDGDRRSATGVGDNLLDGEVLRLRDGDLRWWWCSRSRLPGKAGWWWCRWGKFGGLEGLPDGGRAISDDDPGVTASNAEPSGEEPTLEGLSGDPAPPGGVSGYGLKRLGAPPTPAMAALRCWFKAPAKRKEKYLAQNS